MLKLYKSIATVVCFANDNDALVPEIWAREGLAILEENMVMANLVHRDFENEIKNFGDVVNTRRPGEFHISRKKDGTTLVPQDAKVTNVAVPLDQWFTNTFVIKDGEQSLSMQDLITLHLEPAAQVMARSIDRAILGRTNAFLANKVGKLGGLTPSVSKDYVLECREKLNKGKVPSSDRRLVLCSASETAILKTDIFLKASERGDGGSALENATLGRILGFNTYMGQNVSDVSGAEVAVGTITNAAPAGAAGSQAALITGYAAKVGEYATVDGNMQPVFVTAVTATADTTAVTLSEANKYATGAGAVLTVYKSCAVKGAYPAKYSEDIVLDGWTIAPQVGQLVAFGTGGNRKVYTIIESRLTAAGEQSILVDHPLEIALADNDLAFPGPNGGMNLAFHRDCLALVCRPLALPPQAAGVLAGIDSFHGLSMRILMQYDVLNGGTIVNLDMLAGTAVLNDHMASVLLG
jgi:hypothetical protein